MTAAVAREYWTEASPSEPSQEEWSPLSSYSKPFYLSDGGSIGSSIQQLPKVKTGGSIGNDLRSLDTGQLFRHGQLHLSGSMTSLPNFVSIKHNGSPLGYAVDPYWRVLDSLDAWTPPGIREWSDGDAQDVLDKQRKRDIQQSPSTDSTPILERPLERLIKVLLENTPESQERRRMLEQVQARLDESRHILDLPADWDDQGALPVDRQAWDLAQSILTRGIETLRQEQLGRFWLPYISPGPDGSVDLAWMSDGRYLLLNCRMEGTTPVAGFYGDDGTGNFPIEGTFDAEGDTSWLIHWLTA